MYKDKAYNIITIIEVVALIILTLVLLSLIGAACVKGFVKRKERTLPVKQVIWRKPYFHTPPNKSLPQIPESKVPSLNRFESFDSSPIHSPTISFKDSSSLASSSASYSTGYSTSSSASHEPSQSLSIDDMSYDSFNSV